MTSPVTFVQQTIAELKQVSWPKSDEVIRMTTLVIIVSILVGLFIGALDFTFTSGLNYLLKQ